MRDKLINYLLLLVLMIISILPGFALAQIVSGSVNTPSGYSIDSITGNLIPYDSSLKTNASVTSNLGSFTGSFDPTDGYTFSYVSETIGWSNISLSTFPHGYQNTGAVFVTGFMYGLKYRFPCANSIGGSCDNTSGPQDTLQVEIGYYPSAGSPDFRIHQLGLKNQTDGNSAYNLTWQQLAETYTFSGAKPLAQAGAVNMSIIGQDAGFWACLMPDCYGPQVKDAYIRANYSVDPCILNPAFSPNCPGFQNVLQGAKSPTFYYSYSIAQSLPHIGGGVQLHGYDYGFNWWNYGACYNTFMFWCTDWRTDGGGNINFRITDKNNTALFYDKWYVSGNNSGGSFSARYLFTESQNSLNMGSVQWWASDVWNHFGFTGWTRPIWTPDPCYDQPLYSPNCSNFDAEIKRLAAEQKTLQDAQLATTVASVSTTPVSTITTTIQDATTTTPTVSVVTTEKELTKTTPTTNVSLNTDTVSTTRNAINRPESSISTDTALSLIRQNQQREIAISTQASQNAIQTASIAATNSVRQAENIGLEAAKNSQSVEKENTSILEVSNNLTKQDQLVQVGPQSIAANLVSLSSRQQQTEQDLNALQQSTSTSAVVIFNAMSPTAAFNIQELSLAQPSTTTGNIQEIKSYQPPVQQQLETSNSTIPKIEAAAIQTTPIVPAVTQTTETATNVYQTIHQSNNTTPTQEITITTVAIIPPVINIDIPVSANNFTTDRINPINNIIEAKSVLPEVEQRETKTSSIKQNNEDNTVAGPVSISTIAVVPVGFSAYTVALADASFYQPKEIYRNQRTIDNRRVLQNLRSDQLHQQMINQQYGK